MAESESQLKTRMLGGLEGEAAAHAAQLQVRAIRDSRVMGG
jgi:hypothetical protein